MRLREAMRVLNGGVFVDPHGEQGSIYPAPDVIAFAGPTAITVCPSASKSLCGIPPIGTRFFPSDADSTWYVRLIPRRLSMAVTSDELRSCSTKVALVSFPVP